MISEKFTPFISFEEKRVKREGKKRLKIRETVLKKIESLQ